MQGQTRKERCRGRQAKRDEGIDKQRDEGVDKQREMKGQTSKGTTLNDTGKAWIVRLRHLDTFCISFVCTNKGHLVEEQQNAAYSWVSSEMLDVYSSQSKYLQTDFIFKHVCRIYSYLIFFLGTNGEKGNEGIF